MLNPDIMWEGTWSGG